MKSHLFRFIVGLGIAIVAQAATAGEPKSQGDWPMSRGNLLRSNRGSARGTITGAPAIAWKHPIGNTPATSFTADFDDDGRPESYSAENWRIVRRDDDGRVVWKSEMISRAFSLVAFDDLDGDGRREPLMEGSGLNSASPLYFVFDPVDGRIRWRHELPASNGGETYFGKIDPSRKGMQLARALFPNPGEGQLHLFGWDRGVEEGYRLWSWMRADDHIYFPQLAMGDLDRDGRNEIFLLSHMCVRAFDAHSGDEVGRVAWGPRARSYGGHFGVWPMKPDGSLSLLVVSAFNRVSVIDQNGPNLALRWDHPFEPHVGDSDLKGELQFLPEGVCDLDGDGWAEVVVNECDGQGEGQWSTIVLGAKDGRVLSEVKGFVVVGAADLDGDAKAEVFLRRRRARRDLVSGPVVVARWKPGDGLSVVWTAPADGTLVREPISMARFGRPSVAVEQVKLAEGAGAGDRVFFVREDGGQVQAFEPSAGDFRNVDRAVPPDRPQRIAGWAAPGRSRRAPLAVDLDGDGRNEVIQETAEGTWTILKAPQIRKAPPEVLRRLEGLRTAPLFADLDGDDCVEIIAVRLGKPEGSGELEQACLEVTRADGRPFWRKTWPADRAYKHTASLGGFGIPFVSVGRFTRGDALDVVISYAGEQSEGHTAVLDGRTGTTVWDIQKLYPNMYGTCWDSHPPVVFDYDQDGLDDLATVCQTVHYTVLRGKDGKQLLDRPRSVTGQPVEGGAPLFPGGWAVGAMLGGAVVDGNGRPNLAVFSSQGPVGVFRASGEAVWFLNLPVVDQVPSPGCWADLNGDGSPEVVYLFKDGKIGVYDARSGKSRWEQKLDSLGSLVAADIDGDRSDEILFSSEKGRLYCLSDRLDPQAGNHIRWTWEFDGVPGPAIFADVTGDNAGQILVPVSDGYLYSLFEGSER